MSKQDVIRRKIKEFAKEVVEPGVSERKGVSFRNIYAARIYGNDGIALPEEFIVN